MNILTHHKKKKIYYFLKYLLVIVVCVCVMSPIYYMVTTSFKFERDVLTQPPSILPRNWTLDGYRSILTNPDNIRAFINSVIVGLSVTIISLIIAALAGYSLSRFRFKGKEATSFFILVTQMVPPVILLLPYFLIISKIGLYNTYFALIITYVSFTIPFCTLMLRSFFDSIPRELDEAALIDGCSWFQTLFRIIVPISVPSIIATGAFAFILSWTELLFAICLTSGRNMIMVTIAVVNNIGKFSFKWNDIMALSMLNSIPLVIAWIFLQKYIIEGMTSGAMKY